MKKIQLPNPDTKGGISLEETILGRSSCREFKKEPLTQHQISQLLWVAYGLKETDTVSGSSWTVPSAGATYPMEIYLVEPEGISRYIREDHLLAEISSVDLRGRLSASSLRQEAIEYAPAVFVIACVYRRICGRYGQRGIRYAYIEAGHIAQNILLEGVSLGLQGVPIGAFHDEDIKRALNLPDDHEPLYIIPIGFPR